MRTALVITSMILLSWGLLVWQPWSGQPPLCRNYSGTERDSGYPCRIDHSDGSTEYLYEEGEEIVRARQWPAQFLGMTMPVWVPIVASFLGALGIGILWLAGRQSPPPIARRPENLEEDEGAAKHPAVPKAPESRGAPMVPPPPPSKPYISMGYTREGYTRRMEPNGLGQWEVLVYSPDYDGLIDQPTRANTGTFRPSEAQVASAREMAAQALSGRIQALRG